MIAMFTDFGLSGPYVGQMAAVLYREAPQIPVVNLFSDAPAFNVCASAYLLAAFSQGMPAGVVYLGVVDPGVGTDARVPVVLEIDDNWFVGPDNGLFQLVWQRGRRRRRWEIVWRPERLSGSFHGRDLFAPIAAAIAAGKSLEGYLVPKARNEDLQTWPEDLSEVIYVDRYDNVVSGIRSSSLSENARLRAGGQVWKFAKTFGRVPDGVGFWFNNANGLVELAVNCGRAAKQFGISVGMAVEVEEIS